MPDKETSVEEAVEELKKDDSGITLKLLVDIKKILEIAISRGAFRADELTALGGVYDQLYKGVDFLVQSSQ